MTAACRILIVLNIQTFWMIRDNTCLELAHSHGDLAPIPQADCVHGVIAFRFVKNSDHNRFEVIPSVPAAVIFKLCVKHSNSALWGSVESQRDQCVWDPLIWLYFVKIVLTVAISLCELLNIIWSIVQILWGGKWLMWKSWHSWLKGWCCWWESGGIGWNGRRIVVWKTLRYLHWIRIESCPIIAVVSETATEI